MRRRIGEVASVEKAELLALSLKQATVRFHFFGNEDQLRLAFAQRDMELKQEAVGWQLQLRAGSGTRTTGAETGR